jgi:hypothetical protein
MTPCLEIADTAHLVIYLRSSFVFVFFVRTAYFEVPHRRGCHGDKSGERAGPLIIWSQKVLCNADFDLRLCGRLHSLAWKTRTLSSHLVSLERKYENRFTDVFLKSLPKRGSTYCYWFPNNMKYSNLMSCNACRLLVWDFLSIVIYYFEHIRGPLSNLICEISCQFVDSTTTHYFRKPVTKP